MAVGSAFDAYVKSHLHEKLFGKGHKDSDKFDRDALFEAQVEPQCRDEAKVAGQYVFERYLSCGALADLMLELNKSINEPRFEMAVQGVVDGYREGITAKKGGVPLLGKPDLYFINEHGAHIIHDWKVNGYYSKSAPSPVPGYVKIRDAWEWCEAECSRGGVMHKDCLPMMVDGMEINGASCLEAYKPDWAAQLATYGWLMGEPVGKEIISSVDQIVCKTRQGKLPLLRVATHRSKIGQDFQFKTLNEYQNLWGLINSEPFHFFRDSTLAESQGRCSLLDSQATTLYGDTPLTDEEQWILDVARM